MTVTEWQRNIQVNPTVDLNQTKWDTADIWQCFEWDRPHSSAFSSVRVELEGRRECARVALENSIFSSKESFYIEIATSDELFKRLLSEQATIKGRNRLGSLKDVC